MVERRLTVLQVLPALHSGGVERGTLEIAAALVQAGHRSLVLSAGGRLVEQLRAQGSEHIALALGRKSLFTLRHVPALRRLCRAEQVDIMHARSRMPAWVAWLAWRGMPPERRPHLVTTVHGLYSVNAYSRIMTRGERVIAVSDTARRYIAENYPGVDLQRVVTIHRGVDRAQFPYGYRPDPAWLAQWHSHFPRLQGKQLLTLAGRLTRLKGHADFITLIGKLVERNFQVHGLVVGDLDPRRQRYISELRQSIDAAGLAQHVSFIGQRSDIREIYACSALVLSLSRKPESFGRSVLEPLCMGVPVVGYDHGGVGEILARIYPQGRSPVGDIDQLASRVAGLLKLPVPVAQSDEFTLAEMTSRTLSLYADLVPA
jgi:glycosyltransferase involved in cell wall biosynthesis